MVKTQIIHGKTIVSGVPSLIPSDSSHSDGGSSSEVKSPTSEHDSQLHLWFDEFISKAMKIPERYIKVTVKVISWSSELDDLNCEEEVRISDTLSKYD